MGLVNVVKTYVSEMANSSGQGYSLHQRHYAATSKIKHNEFEEKAAKQLRKKNAAKYNGNIDFFDGQTLTDLVDSYQPNSFFGTVGRSLERVGRTIPGFSYSMSSDEMLQVAKVLRDEVQSGENSISAASLEQKISKTSGDVEKALTGFTAHYATESTGKVSGITSAGYTNAAYEIRSSSGKNWMDVIRPSKSVKSIVTAAAIAATPLIAGGLAAAGVAYGTSKLIGGSIGVGTDVLNYYARGTKLEKLTQAGASVGQMAMYGFDPVIIVPMAAKFVGELSMNAGSSNGSTISRAAYSTGKFVSVLADYAQMGSLVAKNFNNESSAVKDVSQPRERASKVHAMPIRYDKTTEENDKPIDFGDLLTGILNVIGIDLKENSEVHGQKASGTLVHNSLGRASTNNVSSEPRQFDNVLAANFYNALISGTNSEEAVVVEKNNPVMRQNDFSAVHSNSHLSSGYLQNNIEPAADAAVYTFNVERSVLIDPKQEGMTAAIQNLTSSNFYLANAIPLLGKAFDLPEVVIQIGQYNGTTFTPISDDLLYLGNNHALSTLENVATNSNFDFSRASGPGSVAAWEINSADYDGTDDGIFNNVIFRIQKVNNDGTISQGGNFSWVSPYLAIQRVDLSNFANNQGLPMQIVNFEGKYYQTYTLADMTGTTFAGTNQHPDGYGFATLLGGFMHTAQNANDTTYIEARAQHVAGVSLDRTDRIVYQAEVKLDKQGYISPQSVWNAPFRLDKGVEIKVTDADHQTPVILKTDNDGVATMFSDAIHHFIPQFPGYVKTNTGIDRHHQAWDYLCYTLDEMIQAVGGFDFTFPKGSKSLDPHQYSPNDTEDLTVTEEAVICGVKEKVRNPPEEQPSEEGGRIIEEEEIIIVDP